MAVAVDSSGERRHLSVAEVSAISVLALRQPYTLARVAGDATVLDGRAEDLAQQPESILDRWGANVVGCHLRHPSASPTSSRRRQPRHPTRPRHGLSMRRIF